MQSKYFLIAALFAFSPMALAQEATVTSFDTDVRITANKNVTLVQKTDPRSLYHFNRGENGKGYTRFYGQRVGNSGNYKASSAFQQNQARAIINRYKIESVDTPTSTTTKLEVEKEAYSPVRFYHRNSYKRNYGRYSNYQRLNRLTSQ